MPDSFYIPDGDDRYISTEHTIGPWGPESQHGGPPAALLGRALEATAPDGDSQIASISFDILKPVPIAPLSVAVEVVRPGRSVALIQAALRTADGDDVMRARAWRIRTEPLDLGYDYVAGPAPPPPETGRELDMSAFRGDVGYHTSIDWRFIRGDFLDPGPATTWFRAKHPLVAGEEMSPLCRVLIAADSASGISATLDWYKWLFVNPDLTVHLHRLPVGEWVCLDAVTYPEPHGIGMAASVVWDEQGPIGRTLQSLFIAPQRG